MKTKFALYKYSTINSGDEIQSIAARRFLPQVDYYIDRDELKNWKNLNRNEEVRLISNAWYTGDPFPPKDKSLKILPISMHLEDEKKTRENFCKQDNIDFLNKSGPVGARDIETERFFREKGIDTYFSGCLTLTLQKDPEIKRQDFILAIDVSAETVNYMRSKTSRKVIEISTVTSAKDRNNEERFQRAEHLLYMYQSAHAIVTSRLHTMLPSLAFDTPVLFISNELSGNYDPHRYDGLDKFVRKTTAENYFKNYDIFDLDNPKKNSDDFREIREKLIKKCSDFTGYNNDKTWRKLDFVNISQPIVSVIIPIYNVEKYLKECLDSVVNQTYKNLEIILVNDKSTDNCDKIADDFAKKDTRIKVIHKDKNEGLNSARETGFKNSQGDLITFIDSDDKFTLDAVEKLVKLHYKTGADISMAGYKHCDEKMKPFDKQPFIFNKDFRNNEELSQDEMIDRFLHGWEKWNHNNNPTNVYCKLFTRNILDQIDWKLSNYRIGEDDFHSLLTFKKAKNSAVINDIIYYYRTHKNSLSHSKNSVYKYREREISAFELCNQFNKLANDLLLGRFKNEIDYKTYVLIKYYFPNDESVDNLIKIINEKKHENQILQNNIIEIQSSRAYKVVNILAKFKQKTRIRTRLKKMFNK